MTAAEKPFSPSCERNQLVLLDVLQTQLRTDDQYILEIGSGTGQHAVFFAQHLPDIIWQTSDLIDRHSGIQMWLDEAGLDNVLAPIEYQIGKSHWPDFETDVVFSANTLHIMSFELVKTLIKDMGQNLKKDNLVMFYGPFKYQNEFTSESNADFEQWLQESNPLSGIRDFEVIDHLMNQQGFILLHDINMPANNQLLIFEKQD